MERQIADVVIGLCRLMNVCCWVIRFYSILDSLTVQVRHAHAVPIVPYIRKQITVSEKGPTFFFAQNLVKV